MMLNTRASTPPTPTPAPRNKRGAPADEVTRGVKRPALNRQPPLESQSPERDDDDGEPDGERDDDAATEGDASQEPSAPPLSCSMTSSSLTPSPVLETPTTSRHELEQRPNETRNEGSEDEDDGQGDGRETGAQRFSKGQVYGPLP
ncbi:hypothetical protein Q8F55_007903 [Vanrija albida]|uniref:Uncharacterized protein n=1 Tax=Vanrija albida TaxID=181172 RepID=A0ABR3PUV4_9TREE